MDAHLTHILLPLPVVFSYSYHPLDKRGVILEVVFSTRAFDTEGHLEAVGVCGVRFARPLLGLPVRADTGSDPEHKEESAISDQQQHQTVDDD